MKKSFDYLQATVERLAGIHLNSSKQQFILSRLRTRIIELGLTDLDDYCDYLQQLPTDHEEWQKLINSITTNKTEWFREIAHFNFLINEFLPKWIERGPKDILKIWSAACSTGEEPYSLAGILRHHMPPQFRYHILATDIDTEVLSFAQNGVYPKDRFQSIPLIYQNNFFSFGTGDISNWMKVKKEIKSQITFQQFNLTQINYPWNSEFHLIFCRNVFIYFKHETIEKIVDNMYDSAANGGHFLTGHSESLQAIKLRWKYVRPSLYYKKGSE